MSHVYVLGVANANSFSESTHNNKTSSTPMPNFSSSDKLKPYESSYILAGGYVYGDMEISCYKIIGKDDDVKVIQYGIVKDDDIKENALDCYRKKEKELGVAIGISRF
ncbi:unnamed protein product [Rhizophagus irregularis]|nr:unnamed protein product [Rhizophagus irregularis]